jgi:hypothetical protein
MTSSLTPSLHGTGISINSGRVKVFSWIQTSSLSVRVCFTFKEKAKNEKFEDIKGIIISRKSKKKRQYHG